MISWRSWRLGARHRSLRSGGQRGWGHWRRGLRVREAGGRATFTEGDEEFLSAGTIVVSNGLLHEQMLLVLREGDAAPLPQEQFHTHCKPLRSLNRTRREAGRHLPPRRSDKCSEGLSQLPMGRIRAQFYHRQLVR